MEKSINDYIKELKEMAERSRFPKGKIVETFSETPPNNTASGTLELSVTHSQNTFPVSNAKFTVYDKNGNIIKTGITDSSGKSPKLSLPAIPRSLTEQPGSELINSAIFYNVTIEAENYIPFTIKNIPVFEEVTTLQNFDMTFFGASPNGLPQTVTLPTENNL